MTDQTDNAAGSSAPGDGPPDTEMGQPIAELAQLEWQPGDQFGRRVTGSIERRLLTGRLLDVAWSAPLMVLLELLRVPFESFSRAGNRRR